MKIVISGLAILVCMIIGNSASAEDLRYYTAHSTLNDVKIIGGIGPKEAGYRGASWSGTAHITESTGYKVTVNFSCVSMDQPHGPFFNRRVTCDHISESGSTASSSVVGCRTETEDGREMSCTGYLEVKTGDIKGRLAHVTEYYKFSETGGTSTRTDHWIK